MASFSIDDVRVTLTNDVTGLLSMIDKSARELLATPGLSFDEDDGPLFGAVGDHGHAIYGTAALVGADALASSARVLEDLAIRGRAELKRAREHASRARLLAGILVDAASEMRAMLDLELLHQSDDAQWVGLAWQERATELLALADATQAASDASEKESRHADPEEVVVRSSRRPSTLHPPPGHGAEVEITIAEDSFSDSTFADEGDAGGAVATSPVTDEPAAFSFEETRGDPTPAPLSSIEVVDELRGIFEQEARELVVSLRGHLEVVFAEPDNVHAVRHVERIYHTLKGAAATVGLSDVSARAAVLQQRVERVVDGTSEVTPDFLAQLLADTNDLLGSARIAPLQIAMTGRVLHTSARTSPDAEARAHFVLEARRIHGEASGLVDELTSAAPERAREIGAALRDLFHRLKGSALVVEERGIAAAAQEAEAACADGASPPDTAEPSRCLARVAAALGFAALVDRGPKPGPEHDEAREAFLEEAREILMAASAPMGELLGDEAHRARADLARLFHRLMGSALVVQENVIAEISAELERVSEDPELSIADCCEVITAGARDLAHILEREPPKRVSFVAGSVRDPGAEPASGGVERHLVSLVDDRELWQAFTQECGELLESLEREILLLEESTDPREALKTILRHEHTLKGVIQTMGLAPTGVLLHRVEDFVERLVETAILPSMRNVASLLLSVQTDVRRNLKQASKGYVETAPSRLQGRIAELLLDGATALRATQALQSANDSISSHGSHGSRGTGKSAPWRDADSGDRKFIRVSTERLDTLMNLAGELVVSRSRLMNRVQSLHVIQSEMGRGNKRMTDTVETFREQYEFARIDGRRTGPRVSSTTSAAAPPSEGGAALAAPASPWGVFSELELDRYEDVNILARSLAEITSDFSEVSGEIARGLASFTDDADIFGRIVSGIQSEVTRARMVPLDFLFTRLRLPIRDAAVRSAKEVKVVTIGEDVSLDKTIADALFEPMIHLVRNAVAHGIEGTARRERAGKQAAGTITLSARQESGQIVVEVRDDGGGLDLERLRERGIEMGLVPESVALTDPAVKELVFAEGLSTERSAGDVAGRGIGCDVVRRAVERLNGSIRVETRAGKGTTFVVTLPLTLAITRALLVKQGSSVFAVPLYFAERIIDAPSSAVVESAGVRRIKVDDAYVHVKRLGTVLGGAETSDDRGPILLLRVGEQRIALQVDAVVGQEEVVVKGLGALLTGHPLFAGVTIRGTGGLVLIMDVPGIISEDKSDGATTRRRRRTDEVAGHARPAPAGSLASHSSADEDVVLVDAFAGANVPVGRIRALFVDDSLSVRKVAERTLGGLDVDVTLAVDGLDALERLREGSFDIIFTDLEMPRMHGYELIRELRFLPAYADLPIVVVTSRSGQKHQDQARSLGATDYMTKPFSAQTLESALTRWVRRR